MVLIKGDDLVGMGGSLTVMRTAAGICMEDGSGAQLSVRWDRMPDAAAVEIGGNHHLITDSGTMAAGQTRQSATHLMLQTRR